MHDPKIDPAQVQDITENPYYKQLQKSLKARLDRQKNAMSDQSKSEDVQSQHVQTESDEFQTKSKQKKATDWSKHFDIEDDVRLSSFEWGEALTSDVEDKESSSAFNLEDRQKQDQQLTKNAENWIQHLAHKIDFKNRKPELKELFRYNIIQSKSHNYYLSKFSKFKVGVVGQILSWLGMSVNELNELKGQALNEAFEENIESMAENLYNTELALLIYGDTRKSKRSLKLYQEVQTQLIQRMENLGRRGYWSKERMLEERKRQVQKIKEEFIKEKSDLTYEYHYRLQAEAA